MVKVALTGGIATGKSYCLARFAARGFPVIDADRLAREAVSPGSPGLAAIAAHFGPGLLTSTGALERAKLAAIIFADSDARRHLEAIVHPVVYQGIARWFDELEAGGRPIGMADIPLLYETDHSAAFDRVVVAACPPELQVRRLVVRNGLSEVEAARRLAAQWPIAEKVKAADFVIDTSGSLEETDRQVGEVLEALVALTRPDDVPV